MKKERSRIILILITSFIAIAIVSFTVGREWYEGKSQSLTSFGLIHFSGYLFFLLMPVEMAFVYYLSYFREAELIGVAMATAVVAQVIDYLIGLLVSKQIIQNLVSEKSILKAEKYIHRFGNLTIFLFNVLPLSSPVIVLTAGIMKFSFKNLMIYSVSGLFFKYLILSLIF